MSTADIRAEQKAARALGADFFLSDCPCRVHPKPLRRTYDGICHDCAVRQRAGKPLKPERQPKRIKIAVTVDDWNQANLVLCYADSLRKNKP